MKNLFLLLLFSTTTFFYAQNTYTVDNKPGAPADYTGSLALQNAVDDVPTGSTLLVQGSPDNYYGSSTNSQIIITKQLTIIGPGYLLEENPDTQAYKETAKIYNMQIAAGAEGTIISGFDFDNFYLYINVCNNVTIKNSYFHRGADNGIRYDGIIVESSEEIMIQNCFLPYNYIHFSSASGLGIISNIVLYGNYLGQYSGFSNGANPIVVSLINNTLGANFNQSLSIQALIAYNNIFLAPEVIASSSNVHNNIFVGGDAADNSHGNLNGIYPVTIFIPDTDPRYSDDGQFILSDTSPAIGAGENNKDCGMFGGTYRLSGLSNVPNIYEFTMPDTGYTNDGGIPITIKVKSNN